MTASLLAEWDNFYVIVGPSAGGLTGLTFVVIALASDAKRVNLRGLRVYVTPTIVHFGAVLLLSIGIHNAWDIAVYNTVTKPGEPS